MTKIKKHFDLVPDKIFRIITCIYCFLGDLLICAYLWNIFSNIEYFFKLLNLVFPFESTAFDQQFKEQLFQLNLQSLKVILILYLLLHITVYVSHLLKRSFAYKYLKLFVWIAAPCATSFGLVSLIERDGIINGLFFVQGLLYSYVALGFLYKKDGTTN